MNLKKLFWLVLIRWFHNKARNMKFWLVILQRANKYIKIKWIIWIHQIIEKNIWILEINVEISNNLLPLNSNIINIEIFYFWCKKYNLLKIYHEIYRWICSWTIKRNLKEIFSKLEESLNFINNCSSFISKKLMIQCIFFRLRF